MQRSVWCSACDKEFIAEEEVDGNCPYCGLSYYWSYVDEDYPLLIWDNDFL